MPMRPTAIALALCLASCPVAQAQKSRRAPIVHVKIVGDYAGRTVIAYREDGGQAQVTDRVVVAFDWHARDSRIVGAPSIENEKSQNAGFRNVETNCPPPVARGHYEHLDARLVRVGGSDLIEIVGPRTYPAVDVTAYCRGAWAKKSVAARTEEAVERIGMPVVESMPHGMPFPVKAGNWTWTFTVGPAKSAP